MTVGHTIGDKRQAIKLKDKPLDFTEENVDRLFELKHINFKQMQELRLSCDLWFEINKKLLKEANKCQK